MFDEKNDDPANRDSFIANRGWCENFIRRHGFSVRRKTTTAQKDPSFLKDRLVSYIMHVRQLQKQHSFALSDILAMDETPVWNDMVSNTTVKSIGARDVPMKSTGHDKVRLSVCLTEKVMERSASPLMLFLVPKENLNPSTRNSNGDVPWPVLQMVG